MSLNPVHVDFVGFDALRQGTDWDRAVNFPASMAVYDPAVTAGAVTRGAIKSADLAKTYAQSSDGTMLLTWLSATQLRVRVTAAGSAALSLVGAPIPYVFQGAVLQIEGKSGITGLLDQLVEGTAEMLAEVCTSAT